MNFKNQKIFTYYLCNINNYLYNIKTDKKEYIKYSSVSSFYNNYSVVQDEKGRYGIIDSEFNEVVPTLFDSITRVGENYIIDDKLVDIKTFKYEMKLELYSDNNKQLYERKFNKKENLDAAYDYFENEIENYEKKKDKYAYKIENEFSDMFKDEDIRKIKRNVKVK